MLKGFTNETAPLNDYEQQILLPVLVRCLGNKVGRINSVTNTYICTAMRKAGYKLSDARLRKVINYIRNHGLVKGLIATCDGYYVAETAQELRDYAESLRSRAEAIESVRRAILRQAQEMFQPIQQNLFA